jgi:hypothetical protein
MRKVTTVALSLCLIVAGSLAAQEAKKPLSPAAKATAEFGGKKVTVDYSAPSKRGRVVMGELVPYGKVWRTGANAATTLETSADLMIGSLHVPAGKYTLFTVPTANDWTLVVSKQKDLWGTRDYDEKQDLGRVKMNVKKLDAPVETFVIAVKSTDAHNGVLSLSWENVEASVPVMVH